ncbi:MAG: hypothetical protein ACJ8FY_28620, partial [Gemmataceae bacterium]
PLILLVGSRLAYWPWIGNRLVSLRPLVALIACGVLAVGWIGSQLAYRVLEVPFTQQAFDVKEFIATLPTAEKNIAGRALKDAGIALERLENEESQQFHQQGMPPEAAPPGRGNVPMMVLPSEGAGGQQPRVGAPRRESVLTFDQEMTSVLNNGWGNNKKDHLQLGAWVTRLFTVSWRRPAEEVRKAAALPPDVVVDPLTPPADLDYKTIQSCGWIVNVFVLRGMQLQAGGDYKPALEHFLDALSVSRHMRQRALISLFTSGLAGEKVAVHAIDLWRQELSKDKQVSYSPKTELLQTALERLALHEESLPSLLDCLKAEYLFVRNELYDPKITEARYGSEKRSAVLHAVVEARLLEALPWEKARVDRLLDSVFAGWMRALTLDYPTLQKSLQTDQQVDQLMLRSGRANRYVLGGWAPAEGDGAGQLSRERLAALIDHSWLRDILPFSIPRLGASVTENLSRLRLLRIRMAVALHNAKTGNEGRLGLFDKLVEMNLLPAIPINPLTDSPFAEADLQAPPATKGVPKRPVRPLQSPPG